MTTKRSKRTLRRHRPDLVERSGTTAMDLPTSSPETPQSVEVESQKVFRAARSAEQHAYGLRQASLKSRNTNRWT